MTTPHQGSKVSSTRTKREGKTRIFTETSLCLQTVIEFFVHFYYYTFCLLSLLQRFAFIGLGSKCVPGSGNLKSGLGQCLNTTASNSGRFNATLEKGQSLLKEPWGGCKCGRAGMVCDNNRQPPKTQLASRDHLYDLRVRNHKIRNISNKPPLCLS